jgi:chromosome segregation ATPase
MSEVASLQQRLNEHLVRWDASIKELDKVMHEYGERKADLEHRRATVKAIARADNPKLSGVIADDLADADEDAYLLHREYRGSEASMEALKARLRWCAAVADALRTEISSERSNAALYNTVPGI